MHRGAGTYGICRQYNFVYLSLIKHYALVFVLYIKSEIRQLTVVEEFA